MPGNGERVERQAEGTGGCAEYGRASPCEARAELLGAGGLQGCPLIRAPRAPTRGALSLACAMTDAIAALRQQDAELATLVDRENIRQHETLRLIASENYASHAVQQAVGSALANKYSEGYAGKRYYEGQEVIDAVENLAAERIKELFGAEHANVQPYSGSPANQAVYFAFLQPGDKVMGLGLPHGGHLTHGWNVNFSGKYFDAVQYGVDRETERIDYDEVRALAREHRPKLLIAGITAYPRFIDWAVFREIADEVGAIFMADIAHIPAWSRRVCTPSPVPYADVVTSTTHKTLRGPRGGMILCKQEHAKAINRAVFPGLRRAARTTTRRRASPSPRARRCSHRSRTTRSASSTPPARSPTSSRHARSAL